MTDPNAKQENGSGLPTSRLLAVPKSERTQKQWDELHAIYSDHKIWCNCQACKEVEEYLHWLHTGGTFHV